MLTCLGLLPSFMASPALLLLLFLSTPKRILTREVEPSPLEEVAELGRHSREEQKAAEREKKRCSPEHNDESEGDV